MIKRISDKFLWIISGDVIPQIANKQLSLLKNQGFFFPPLSVSWLDLLRKSKLPSLSLSTRRAFPFADSFCL